MVLGSSLVERRSRLTRVVILNAILLGLTLTIGSRDSHAELQAPVPSPVAEENLNRGAAHLKLMETSVMELALAASEVYPASCEDWVACDVCTQDECHPLTGEVTCANVSNNARCNSHFPNCPSSITYTLDQGTVSFPRASVDSSPDYAQARTICGTVRLDETLENLFKKSPYYNEYYVGFTDGTRRAFPGREEADPDVLSCQEYDCRKRPWYNAAISYKNHLIILVDSRQEPLDPAYTEKSDTLSFAKEYAKKLLETGNNQDRVNVVPFSTSPVAQALENESVRVEFNVSAPENHVELQRLKQKLADLGPAQDGAQVSSANLTAGLQEAMNLFSATSGMATKNIVVITNGDISYDVGLNLTLKQVADDQVRLFIFSMRNTDTKLKTLDAVAKTALGVHIRLTTSANPLYRMRAYFSYLARVQALSNRTVPLWTPSYKDYYDVGDIITVAAPVFSRSDPKKLIGVAAADVLYQEIGDILSDFRDALYNRQNNEGVIGDDIFNSVTVYDDTSESIESCDFESNSVAVTCEVGPVKNENFLDRMCCQKCSGNDESAVVKIAIIIGTSMGVVLIVSCAIVKFCCCAQIAADPQDLGGLDTNSDTNPEPVIPLEVYNLTAKLWTKSVNRISSPDNIQDSNKDDSSR